MRASDVVVAQYVITRAASGGDALTTSPGHQTGPARCADQHIGAGQRAARAFEKGSRPHARRLGWRPEFRFGTLGLGPRGHGGVRVIERRAMPPSGIFADRFGALPPRGLNGRVGRYAAAVAASCGP